MTGAPQTLDLDVTAVGTQGDGLARGPGGPVFVPLTLPGERVRATLEGDRAVVVKLLQASPDRIEPVSPHYGACGGCSLQHWASAPYLAWKQEQVRQALAWERIETDIAETIPCPPGSRRRLALHARPRKGGAVLGFKSRRSWSLVEVEVCPIADPAIMRALPGLRRLAQAFFEHPKSAPTLHVTATLSGLDVDVTGVERRKGGGLSADARMRAADAAAAANLARVTMAGEAIYGARQPMVRLGPATVALPPGAFLQAVPQSEAAMARLAVEAVAGAKGIADLFCGVGTFAFRLAEVAPVLAADSGEGVVQALLAAVGSASGLKSITAETRDLFRRPFMAEEMKRCDAIVFDPPRAGAIAQVGEIARSKAATVVGVSCNPVTFARDARVLIDAGFKLERVTTVDQFLWSPHIELVGVFRR